MALSPNDPSSFSCPEHHLLKDIHLEVAVDFSRHVLTGSVTLNFEKKTSDKSLVNMITDIWTIYWLLIIIKGLCTMLIPNTLCVYLVKLFKMEWYSTIWYILSLVCCSNKIFLEFPDYGSIEFCNDKLTIFVECFRC